MASKVAVSKIDLSWASPDVNIWIELPENDASGQAYKRGTIINVIDDETASVKYEGSNNAITLKGDKIFPMNNYAEFPEGYDDMVDIENLSEAELLYNVQLRFSQRQIYTYVGPTLIVINPFMKIEKLLSTEVLYKFQDAVMENKLEPKDHMPHVYAIAGATMQKMFENKKNQAVVISGESGAGKTENTKHAMKFLTSLGNKSDDGGAKNNGVEDRILACNPILEAFGNAKTVRNDNSSRFGKYVSLLVEKDSRKIIGATITNYLLEKSRVCNQTSEERNYHIFYALLRGAKPELLQELCLVNDCDAYNYLKNSYQGEVKTVPDGPLFQEVSESFETMAFTDVEQKSIWSLVASSLLLGNVEFDDSALNDTTPCQIKQEDQLKNVAKLLGIDGANFIKSLTFKLRTIGGNTIESTINKEECLIYRDGLAKEIFNRLFNWLVKRLNFNVMPPSFAKPGANIQKLMDQYYHIGLLDIFGFEIFKINSLEQFCINFANERLQQLYIYYVFKAEEKEFINEGLKDYLSQLDFKDNQALLDMLDGNKPPGIFQLLDESSSVNTTDSALGTKIIQTFKKPEYPLTTAKMAKDTFIVKHSAKDVEYDVNGFRAKNKDELSKFIEDNMTNSAIKAVSKIWRNLTLDEPEPLDSKKAINPKDKFLGYKFRMQMKDLIDELNSCECHFVRCIKPNEKKEAALFEPAMVLQQIQYMGVLDTIKVRKQSYPVRRLYKSYYERYQELDPINSKLKFEEHVAKGADFKEMTKNICQRKVPHLGPNQILFGNTRVFLRIEAVKELEKMRSDQIKKKHRTAAKFQATWKRYKQYKKYTALKKGVSEVQKLFKVGKEFQKYLKIKKYTKQLQRKWRYVLWRRYMVKLRQATIKLQAWWRSQYYKKKYLKKMENIKTINRLWRGGKARRKVAKLRHVKEIIASIVHNGAMKILEGIHGHAARKIQPHIRGYLSKCRYSKEVAQIRKTKADFIYNKKIRVIQRNLRGFFVRSTLARIIKAASFIQGHMRMRWHSAYFQILRDSTRRIQKSVRSWLIMRKIIRERMDQFMEVEGHFLEDFKQLEHQNFFGSLTPSPSPTKSMKSNGDKTPNSKLKQRNQPDQEEDTERSKTPTRSPMTPTPVNWDESPKKSTKTFNFNREIDEYTLQKIHLFARVLDFEPISNLDDVYNNSWSMQTLQIQKECMRSGSELQVMEVGQAHTISVSNNKVYSYGWNDSYQLGRFDASNQLSSTQNQIDFSIDLKVKSVATGDDHTLMMDSKANLYVWGDNSQGQLGVGNTLTTSGIKMLSFVKEDQIKEINAKGKQSLVITEKGKAYSWPSQIESQDVFVPCELLFLPKIEIATASCGYNFTVLLSKNGMVFTFGQDNQAGQLGHGDTLPREQPTLIEDLKFEDKITAVSCGYKHVICKSSLGKAYTWGWGSKGQLGNGSFEDQLSPKLLAFSNPDMLGKVLQVQAGFKHSVLLLENKKVFWCGSNASIENECLPVEINLNQKVQSMNINFIPVRILCSWSKTTNLTYITLADARTIDAVTSTKHKITATLTAGFEENQTFKDVYPPNIPSIAKYFSLKTMNPLSSPEKKLGKNSPTVAKSPLTKKPSQIPQNADSPPKIVFSQAGGFQEEESPRSPNKSPLSKSIKSPRPTDSTPTPRKEKLKSRKSVASPTAQLSPTKSAKPHRQTVYTSKPAENYVTGQGMPLLLTSQLSRDHPCQTQTQSFARTEQKTLSPRRRESPVMKTPRSPVMKTPRSPVTKSPRRTDSTSSLDNKILKEMVEEGHAQPLYDTLVEIKKRMQAISVIPLKEWTKSDKKFWKNVTKPAMFKLLQDIRIE